MKEFIYTCEHCGTEYKISEYGQYKCQKCGNVFAVQHEDKFSPTEEEIEEVERKLAEKEKQSEAKAEENTKTGIKKKSEKYYGKVASYVMFFVVIISATVALFSFLSIFSAIVNKNVIFFMSGIWLTSIALTDAIVIYIAYKFFGLFQRMEHHLRKMAKEDLDE